MNKIIITGNLGRDPEMHYTPAGHPVTSFPVASNRKYMDSMGETVQETAWLRVQAWGKLADVCNKYLKKGSKVLVEGRLVVDPQTGGPRVWVDKEGKPHANFEVVAERVEFINGVNSNQTVDANEDNYPF